MNPYTVTEVGANVLVVRFPDVNAGWDQWVLLSADRHHDSIYCDRVSEKRQLEQAKERGAFIIDCGDLFCAMQGKYDPRRSMDDIRPEDVGDDYLDRIVRHAGEFYTPYAENWLLLGKGNHETAILSHLGTDLTSQLKMKMNEGGGRVHIGGFGGWVRFLFNSADGRGRAAINLKYFHGAGKGAEVTRGVISTNRQAVYLPDADVVVNGHTHDSWLLPIGRERISNRGVISRDLVHYVRTPGYKDEYRDGSKGWAVERGGAPKPIGAVWMRMIGTREGGRGSDLKVELEFTQAVT